MNKNLTEIVLIIDRSGSMQTTKNDAEGGINNLIDRQKTLPGQCNLSMYQFDNLFEIVYENQSLDTIIPRYSLVPRGTTALLDAIGETINRVGLRLSKTREQDRPGLVYVCVVTDGEENASIRFNKQQIKQLIAQQTNQYSWKFDFLGSGDSFLQGEDLGFQSTATFSPAKTNIMYKNIDTKLERMRQSLSSNQIVSNNYTAEELRGMK